MSPKPAIMAIQTLPRGNSRKKSLFSQIYKGATRLYCESSRFHKNWTKTAAILCLYRVRMYQKQPDLGDTPLVFSRDCLYNLDTFVLRIKYLFHASQFSAS